jgi:hypothetical protein
MRYLKATMSYPLAFRHQNDHDPPLIAYCDADCPGDISDPKSTSGYVMKLCGALISWKAVRQECVALSTVEPEYIAAATAAKEIVWLRRLLRELALPQHGPTIRRIDNNRARELANNMMINQRTNHIDIRYHFIRQSIQSKEISLEQSIQSKEISLEQSIQSKEISLEQSIQSKEISLEQCATTRMTADALTKPLSRKKIRRMSHGNGNSPN